MKIAVVAPSPVPFIIGGAEKLWWGLLQAINQLTPHDADLIKLPCPDRGFWELMESYRTFSRLDLDHFDLVISTKYPAWMIGHPNHYCYLQHRLRGLYDTYHLCGLPTELPRLPRRLQRLAVRMDDSRAERGELEPFFDELSELRQDPEMAAHFGFPGPLSRRAVHYLDRVALAPGSIRRYLAISRNVINREDYFPAGVDVQVLHHPSDLPSLRCDGYNHIFTASRLDHPKRIDLLIRAYREVPGDLELRIAGTGPSEPELKALAAGDARIRFLGHVTDEQMIAEYAGALFVPFVPRDEDYGLITVEAMQSGKAVLTTIDAGGVNELVEHGRTGLSVEPDEAALADAMRRLLADPAATRAMGEAARERAAVIDWPTTVQVLLREPQGPREVRRRPKIVVAVDFPVHPPRGGGQVRVYQLYKALSARADCVLVTLCGDPALAGVFDLAPDLREIRIAKGEAHREAAARLEQELETSVGDIATLLYQGLSPEYARALADEARDCDLLIASHPYLYPSIAGLDVPALWYEAHNVEYDMKRAVLAQSSGAEPYLEQVRANEAALCARADRIMVCAETDAQRFNALFQVDPARCILVPNGVDTRAVELVPGEERRGNKGRYGLARGATLLFIGSWHQPNIVAVQWLKGLAEAAPWLDILVVGTVCRHPVMEERPDNLFAVGVLDDTELDLLMSAVDLAVNPMQSGSGTNLKMLHYAAAGVPMLSTPFGNRGLAFRDGEHLWLAELDGFAAAIGRILSTDALGRESRVEAARALTERLYDWRAIAAGIDLEGILSRADTASTVKESGCDD